MSQTDLKYDQLFSNQPMKINTYMINSSFVQPTNTFSLSHVGLNVKPYLNSSYITDESKLRGLNQQLNKYPNMIPEKITPNEISTPNPSKPIYENIIGKNTRESKSCNFTNYDRMKYFDILPKDPQNLNHVIFNEKSRGGLNGRIV